MTRLRTGRRPLDFYPTPHAVTSVLREWLASHPRGPSSADQFLDPSAGDGDIIAAMRDSFGESFWHALEINPAHAGALEMVAESVTIADALTCEWPRAHVVANPPFSLLDAFWPMATAHRDRHAAWCAVLTPVAWWNAEKRAGYTRPDFMIALGWRPSFVAKDGPAHKGTQDFCWSVLAPVAQPACEWSRVEKPRALATWDAYVTAAGVRQEVPR